MGIKWLVTYGKTYNSIADVEINYSNGKYKQYAFSISKGAYATKFKNSERILIGFNESGTRLYLAPVKEKIGYKVVNTDRYGRVRFFVSGDKMSRSYPKINPSVIIGTYELKYDEHEELYFISIGALPR